jgi:hypothetical protein
MVSEEGESFFFQRRDENFAPLSFVGSRKWSERMMSRHLQTTCFSYTKGMPKMHFTSNRQYSISKKKKELRCQKRRDG